MADLTTSSVVDALMALANPSAVSFLHVNASNVPTWMTAANYRTALGLGTGDSPTFAGLNGPAGKGTLNLSVGGSFGELAWNGVSNIQWAGGTVNLNAPSIRLGDNSYVYLIPSANTLYQRNGTNAQTFLLANTYTNDSNYERACFGYVSNELIIGHEAAGTGNANRAIKFKTNGFNPLVLDTNNATFGVNILSTGSCTWLVPTSASAGASNRSIAWELTSNTTLTIKVRGTDGTVRSGTITLS